MRHAGSRLETCRRGVISPFSPKLWDEICEEPFELPRDKRLTLAAYEAGPVEVAHVEPVAVGDPLPDMPLYLEPGGAVLVPLEAAYQTAWDAFPAALKGLLEPGLEPPGQNGA